MTRKLSVSSILKEKVSQKSYQEEIAVQLVKENHMTVVLDDDPTGGQTLHSVSVVTDWLQETIDREFENGENIFFILTNSRSFQAEKANEIAKTIGERLAKASKKFNRKIVVLSRGDSTLRGHYPGEVDALLEGLQLQNPKQFLIPAFFDGGRLTIEDVHYYENEGDLIPVGESPFAKDNTFGYTSSNLKEWIVEKTKNAVQIEDINSFSLQQLREKGPEAVSKTLVQNPNNKYHIVNATCKEDLESFALGFLKANVSGVFRCAASFVNAFSNIQKKPLLDSQKLMNSNLGGITIIGSYVPKTTLQLQELMKDNRYYFHEINTLKIADENSRKEVVSEAIQIINQSVLERKDVVLYTSRKVMKGKDGAESLQIVNKVSNCLIEIVKGLKVTPRYILAKGGITSSDMAVKALGVKKAAILGQIIPGVPVWKLGKETSFPDVPYIVFPGNVGNSNALKETLTKLTYENI